MKGCWDPGSEKFTTGGRNAATAGAKPEREVEALLKRTEGVGCTYFWSESDWRELEMCWGLFGDGGAELAIPGSTKIR